MRVAASNARRRTRYVQDSRRALTIACRQPDTDLSELATGRTLQPYAGLTDSSFDVAKIRRLCPTQVTVGRREIVEKRKAWLRLPAAARRLHLSGYVMPIVVGPRAKRYIVGHHQLALALLDEGREHIWVRALADFSNLDEDEFWVVLEHYSFVHPFDAGGHRVGYSAIPRSVTDLVDDPFRSLAREVSRCCGFARPAQPHVEFIWADFLRRRIPPEMPSIDFAAALNEALTLAFSDVARHLPDAPIPERRQSATHETDRRSWDRSRSAENTIVVTQDICRRGSSTRLPFFTGERPEEESR